MQFHTLSWRIGLPFLIFVLLGSMVLVIWMGWNLSLQSREEFQRLAGTNVGFMKRMNLPASERMALQLTEVLGISVFVRTKERWLPEPPALVSYVALANIPADGQTHRSGAMEAVALPLSDVHDLVFVRSAMLTWLSVMTSHTYAILLVFWLAALLLAWVLSRGLVRPLHQLARKLPEIESLGEIVLPEAARPDEIGDVARAYLRTRRALHDERKHREQAEKFAVLGRMTTSLAHEIQNPVSAIKMHAQLAHADKATTTSSLIIAETERIESLVNQWLFLSRPDPPVRSEIHLGKLLNDLVNGQHVYLAHANVEVVTAVNDQLKIRADRRRLTQVFANIVRNGVQAMPDGGRLLIEGRLAEGWAQVAFTDSGDGFSKEALQKHTEYFYSEKEGGMGIGLNVVAEILKAHAGYFTVANHAQGGAVVCVYLPVDPNETNEPVTL